MSGGYLALVLHAHLPYVFHPEREEALEERWLFEAITECYLPFLRVMERLHADQIKTRITLSLSPTLIRMLDNQLLQERYLRHLYKSIVLAESEMERLAGDQQYLAVVSFYLDFLQKTKDQYQGYQHNLLVPIKELQRAGYLEVITTCATHGYLPLMRSRSGWRAQIKTAVDIYQHYFDQSPLGIWLPECAYTPGVDELLRDCEINYFFVDSHGITNSQPRPVFNTFAPVYTRSGVAAFGRDAQCSEQVWDRVIGYPGHPFYREYYRDIGYDLALDYIGSFLPAGHIRVDTGLKYHRITGDGTHKEPYLPEQAKEIAAGHARDFVHKRLEQIQLAGQSMLRTPLLVAPYDAELFGHWWFEGPIWLEYMCREAFHEPALEMITPYDYLVRYPENQVVDLPMCSWGSGGYNDFWLNPATDWMYKHLHHAEDEMRELADKYPATEGLKARCLNQMAMELLLAQSSDWPFIIHSGTAVDYAKQRFNNHIGRFNHLSAMLERNDINEGVLADMESRLQLSETMDYRVYGSSGIFCGGEQARPSRRVLMLSWEYPPQTVGGLARHVYDLANALADLGCHVHVITCPSADGNIYSLERGVHVHRISPDCLTAPNFMDWVEQLNKGMVALVSKMLDVFGSFDLVHAHDWLVGSAAEVISRQLNLPLVATIHATEYGRNQGLHNELQNKIHRLEEKLVQNADKVICCSKYMQHEIVRLFNLPPGKVDTIPNGVELKNIVTGLDYQKQENDGDRTIAFLGRLVPEKGIQVLIAALPLILKKAGSVQLAIAGKGPYQLELEHLAHRMGVGDRVRFIGFVDDEGRNRLLGSATVAVFPSLYEPFGIVALEAMAAGVPVVVSDTGGLGDIIEHGVDGYITPPGDEHMLAHYVAELLNNPELAFHFARRARRNVVEKYNWQQIAVTTTEVYTQAQNMGGQ